MLLWEEEEELTGEAKGEERFIGFIEKEEEEVGDEEGEAKISMDEIGLEEGWEILEGNDGNMTGMVWKKGST